MTPRLKERYQNEVAPALQKEFGYSSSMAIPKIAMIKVNMGLGEAIQNARLIEAGAKELGQITGQKPIVTKARKSIAAFKLRQGLSIGLTVTLRGARMWEFFDRLVNIALPRVRDFRGISPKAFERTRKLYLGTPRAVGIP